MSIDELLNGLAAAGINTQGQVTDLFSTFQINADIRSIDAALEALRAKSQEALAPIENERISLQNKRQTLVENLPKPK